MAKTLVLTGATSSNEFLARFDLTCSNNVLTPDPKTDGMSRPLRRNTKGRRRMATSGVRIGIVGDIGIAWDDFRRLMAMDGVACAGCFDVNSDVAKVLVERFPVSPEPVAIFDDIPSLIRQGCPEALIIATPDRSHYRAAMEGLQAGCHLLLWETPLSTNVQEIVDIVGLAKARDRKVCLTHGFRHIPSLVRAREMLAEGAIGRPRFITSTMMLAGPPPAGGSLALLGVDWIDAVLRTSAGTVETVAAMQNIDPTGVEPATTASLQLAGGVLGSLSMTTGVDRPTIELLIFGETGRLIATGESLSVQDGQSSRPFRAIEPNRIGLRHELSRSDPRGQDSALSGFRGSRSGSGPGGDRPIRSDRSIRQSRVSLVHSLGPCDSPADSVRGVA